MKRKCKSRVSRLDLEQGMNFVLNPFTAKPSSRGKCRGCHIRKVSEWCKYRYWAKESAKGYHFRMYNEHGGKIREKLPLCKQPQNAYKPVRKPNIWDNIPTEVL